MNERIYFLIDYKKLIFKILQEYVRWVRLHTELHQPRCLRFWMVAREEGSISSRKFSAAQLVRIGVLNYLNSLMVKKITSNGHH